MARKIILPKALTDAGFAEIAPGRYRGEITPTLAEALWAAQYPARVLQGSPGDNPGLSDRTTVAPSLVNSVKAGRAPIPTITLRRDGHIVSDLGLIPAMILAGAECAAVPIVVAVEG